MRRLLFSVLAILAVALGCFLLWPIGTCGPDGPAVDPGILRRDPSHPTPLVLAGSTAAVLASGGRDDGLWRVVVISGGDRSPVTRAAMLAAGGVLFTAGCQVVMDPAPVGSEAAAPSPLPTDRVLRISTQAGAVTTSVDGTWTMTCEFHLWEPRLPATHPAEFWQPPPTAMSTRCVVEHRGRPAVGSQGNWGERWAATGQALVQAALGALVPAGGVAVPKEQVAAEWDSPPPAAPAIPGLRWDAFFQHDFIRGWSGSLNGGETAVASRLRSGGWQPLVASANWRRWERNADGVRQCLGLRGRDDACAATLWSERPAANELVSSWISAAGRGDRAARAHLRQATGVLALPADLRARAAAAIR